MAETTTVRDQLASIIRTAVPYGVGLVLAWLAAKYGIIIDENTSAALGAALAVIAGSVYYVLIRALETRVPGLGWLLGLALPPSYSKPVDSPANKPNGTVIPPTL